MIKIKKPEQKAFLLTPNLTHVQNAGSPGVWRCMSDIQFIWNERKFHITYGFYHDFTSVPWPLRWFLGVLGVHAIASVIHDALYQANTGDAEVQVTHTSKHWVRREPTIELAIKWRPHRKQADEIWRDMFITLAFAYGRQQLESIERKLDTSPIIYQGRPVAETFALLRFGWDTVACATMTYWRVVQAHVGYYVLRAFGNRAWNTKSAIGGMNDD